MGELKVPSVFATAQPGLDGRRDVDPILPESQSDGRGNMLEELSAREAYSRTSRTVPTRGGATV